MAHKVNINTLNSELNGVFLRKQHGPGQGVFRQGSSNPPHQAVLQHSIPRPGKVVDRSKPRYPKTKVLWLPFSAPIQTARQARIARRCLLTTQR